MLQSSLTFHIHTAGAIPIVHPQNELQNFFDCCLRTWSSCVESNQHECICGAQCTDWYSSTWRLHRCYKTTGSLLTPAAFYEWQDPASSTSITRMANLIRPQWHVPRCRGHIPPVLSMWVAEKPVPVLLYPLTLSSQTIPPQMLPVTSIGVTQPQRISSTGPTNPSQSTLPPQPKASSAALLSSTPTTPLVSFPMPRTASLQSTH